MLLCTHSMRDDPVFILHLWETGKVSHLIRSSDIHSGIWQASQAHTYRNKMSFSPGENKICPFCLKQETGH